MYLLTVEISVLRPDVNYLFHAALKPSSRVFVKYKSWRGQTKQCQGQSWWIYRETAAFRPKSRDTDL